MTTASATRTPAAPRARWPRLWERLSLYLPVGLMGALALLSYGIVKRLPEPPRPTPTPLAEGQPDYQLERFTWRRYDADGRLESTLTGARLEHHPASGTVWVREAHLERWDRERNTHSVAQARELRTDDARTVYELRGDVRLVRAASPGAEQAKATPSLTLEGQTLTWHTEQRVLESPLPVRVVRGRDVLTGNRLHYDERNGIVDLRGQVRATLVARSARPQ